MQQWKPTKTYWTYIKKMCKYRNDLGNVGYVAPNKIDIILVIILCNFEHMWNCY